MEKLYKLIMKCLTLPQPKHMQDVDMRCCKIALTSHVTYAGFTVHVAVQPPRALPLLHLAVPPVDRKRDKAKKKRPTRPTRGEEDEDKENADGQANHGKTEKTNAESTAACPAADTRATARLFDLGHRPVNMLPVASSSDRSYRLKMEL